ncbi:MAG: peptide deformylase [Magnetococcales bacterium]|nr:peptide deformylase [Magnetococcales bacterium]
MPSLEILTYPDARLRDLADPVTDFSDPSLQTFIDDLLEGMRSGPGSMGLAAPQVGRSIQIIAIDCGLMKKPPPEHHGLIVACNPEILTWSGMEIAREGCLSIPDYTGNVVRATEISVQYQDRHGEEQTLILHGFEARVWQHEVDHLEGRLFIDRIVSRRSDLFKRKVYQPRQR